VAQPRWLMVGEIGGRVLVVPLAPTDFDDPTTCRSALHVGLARRDSEMRHRSEPIAAGTPEEVAMAEKRADLPKALIVCVSKHHGNSHKVASAMAKVLGAKVVEPEGVDISQVRSYDVIGFGSGIYLGVSDPELIELVDRLPPGDGQRVFTFSTSGTFLLPRLGMSHLRDRLRDRHYQVLGDFNCRGLDTVGPLRFIGGVNRGRPNERDLARAAEFAEDVAHRVAARGETTAHGGASRRP
jgi:flavodoxin